MFVPIFYTAFFTSLLNPSPANASSIHANAITLSHNNSAPIISDTEFATDTDHSSVFANTLASLNIYDYLTDTPPQSHPHVNTPYKVHFSKQGEITDTVALLQANVHIGVSAPLELCNEITAPVRNNSSNVNDTESVAAIFQRLKDSLSVADDKYFNSEFYSNSALLAINSLHDVCRTLQNFFPDPNEPALMNFLQESTFFDRRSADNNEPDPRFARFKVINDEFSTRSATSSEQVTRREPRGAPAVIGGIIASIVTAVSLISGGAWIASNSGSGAVEQQNVAISTLDDNAKLARSAISALKNDLDANRDQLRNVYGVLLTMAFSHKCNAFKSQLQAATLAMDAASKGKLSTGFLTRPIFRYILLEARRIAAHNNLQIPFRSSADLVKIPASIYFQDDKCTISFMIPMTRGFADLLKVNAAPILANDHTSEPILIDVLHQHSFVAKLKTKDRSGPVTKEALASCINIGTSFICPESLQLSDTHDTCIQALLFRDRVASATKCIFAKSNSPLHAELLEDSSVRFTSAVETTATISCDNPNDGEHPIVKTSKVPIGASSFTLLHGCLLSTPFSTTSAMARTLAEISVDKTITWDLNSDILHGHSVKAIKDATRRIIANGRTPPNEVQKLLNMAVNLPALPTSTALGGTWTILLGLLSAGLLGMALTVCFLFRLRNSTMRHKRFTRNALSNMLALTTRDQSQRPKPPPLPATQQITKLSQSPRQGQLMAPPRPPPPSCLTQKTVPVLTKHNADEPDYLSIQPDAPVADDSTISPASMRKALDSAATSLKSKTNFKLTHTNSPEIAPFVLGQLYPNIKPPGDFTV